MKIMDENKMEKSLANKVVDMESLDKIAFHSTYLSAAILYFQYFEADLQLAIVGPEKALDLGNLKACCLFFTIRK